MMRRIGNGAFMARKVAVMRDNGCDLKGRNKFIELAVPKYTAGQAEHGGLLTDRNCILEMQQETIDLWHYYQAQKIKDRKKAMTPTSEDILDSSIGRWREVMDGIGEPADKVEHLISALWQSMQSLNPSADRQ